MLTLSCIMVIFICPIYTSLVVLLSLFRLHLNAICRLGPMVAMLRYSLVATYSVSLPTQKLEFSNSIKGEFLKKEIENV